MHKRALDEYRKCSAELESLIDAERGCLAFDKENVILPYSDGFSKLHYHTEYEIGEIISGEGEFICDGRFYSVRQGDMVFIPPSVKHYSRSLRKDSPCYSRFIYVSSDSTDRILRGFGGAVPACDVPYVIRCEEYSEATDLLRGIAVSCYSDITDKEASATLRLAAFLFEAPKWFKKKEGEAAVIKNKIPDDMRNIAEYIYTNYSSSEPSSSLAAICHLSESQLRRKFKQSYGCSPSEYRGRARAEIGKELLIKTDLSVSAIAEKLGFSTASDFCRSFKKICGTSPLKIRTSENQ